MKPNFENGALCKNDAGDDDYDDDDNIDADDSKTTYISDTSIE